MNPQVNSEHYRNNYDTKERFSSYWHQIDEILEREPNGLLDIGKGSGFLSLYLSNLGLKVTTIDIDPGLRPSVVAGIGDLPFTDNSFDMVTCFQVLEHLPHDLFQGCIKEVARVSRQWIIISLPDASKAISIIIRSVGRFYNKIVSVPFMKTKKHIFDGQHYWEIGKEGYPVERINQEITECDLNIIKNYRIHDNLYHRILVLQKPPF